MRLDQASVEISDLVAKIESGRLDIQPDFQRGQVWNDAKKRRLIDTILREWYVPAIHIVVNDDMRADEILDGQQRVRSILDFVNNLFPVQGDLEPHDPSISRLNGLYFSDLPPLVKSKFNRYSIGTIRLRDFSPNEPGELFFRLNQNTSLTAAEQRNALIGEPRNQVRQLADRLEEALSGLRIGFSNARMNYDDVIARLAVTYENGSLMNKIAASDLERRYRSNTAFSLLLYGQLENSIYTLSRVVQASDFQFRLNKASLFSWLLFVKSPYLDVDQELDLVSLFFSQFEFQRYSKVDFEDAPGLGSDHAYRYSAMPGLLRHAGPSWTFSLSVFSDRASSRVNDVSSIILRDLMLHIAYVDFRKKNNFSQIPNNEAIQMISHFDEIVHRMSDDLSERSSLESFLANQWGDRREVR